MRKNIRFLESLIRDFLEMVENWLYYSVLLNRDSERIPRRLSKRSGDPAIGVGAKQRSRSSGPRGGFKIEIFKRDGIKLRMVQCFQRIQRRCNLPNVIDTLKVRMVLEY